MKPLTPRENQILRYLTDGMTNDAIAEALFISKDTVKMYLKIIFQKLEVDNRVSAAVKALRNNIIQ